MHRAFAAGVWVGALALVGAPATTRAQTWNDERARALVVRATERRATQLADTGIASYTATAHGYLTFLAQVGEGFPDPPKVIRSDELALEVYWRAPNYSKQWIIGRRDTLLLPTDIQYHRDHLGIVQNNFPNIIRVGEGDEVRDVPHPLSVPGLATYDFAITDSLRIGIPGRTIDVYEVKMRPRNDRAAAAVGAIYLARDDAQVVRMAFSFTRAALIDKELEDVSIVLENSLIEGRFWLPRRQEVEIRRTGTWLDFPARGIIRGRWEICCYQVNQASGARAPSFFAGPEIAVASPAQLAQHKWTGTILDSLPADVRMATEQDVLKVQAEARALVKESALARSSQTSLSAPSVSRLIRVTRAEGLSLGAGVRRQFPLGIDVAADARFGLSDHEPQGGLGVGWQDGRADRISVRAFREYRDVGDVAEASGIRNTIAAQEFGSDDTDPIDARGVALTLTTGTGTSGLWRGRISYEWTDSVRVAASPATGQYEATLPAGRHHGPVMDIGYDRTVPQHTENARLVLRGDVRLGRLTAIDSAATTFARAYGAVEIAREIGPGQLGLSAAAGAAWSRGRLPIEEYQFAGGPISAPGYAFHQFTGKALGSVSLSWAAPVPFVSIPLGLWGRIPGRAQIVPHVGTVWVDGGSAIRGFRAASGWYPNVGLSLLTVFDLATFDVSRGLRDGRWTFGVDVSRSFWRIM